MTKAMTGRGWVYIAGIYSSSVRLVYEEDSGTL